LLSAGTMSKESRVDVVCKRMVVQRVIGTHLHRRKQNDVVG